MGSPLHAKGLARGMAKSAADYLTEKGGLRAGPCFHSMRAIDAAGPLLPIKVHRRTAEAATRWLEPPLEEPAFQGVVQPVVGELGGIKDWLKVEAQHSIDDIDAKSPTNF